MAAPSVTPSTWKSAVLAPPEPVTFARVMTYGMTRLLPPPAVFSVAAAAKGRTTSSAWPTMRTCTAWLSTRALAFDTAPVPSLTTRWRTPAEGTPAPPPKASKVPA